MRRSRPRVKSRGADALRQGEVVTGVLQEWTGERDAQTFQITSALKYLPKAKGVVLLTDGRFSRRVDGAMRRPHDAEAWAGGPLGKLRDRRFAAGARRYSSARRLGGFRARGRRSASANPAGDELRGTGR